MNRKEMKLAASLFQCEAYGDNCDLAELFREFTDDEKVNLATEFILWNYKDPEDVKWAGLLLLGGPEAILPEFRRISDDSWRAFFAHQLEMGEVYLSCPLQVLPHFGLETSREIINTPEELPAAIERALKVSPIRQVSFRPAPGD